MTEETNSLRSALSEKDDNISKLKIEMTRASSRIIDFKVWSTEMDC